MTTYTKLSHLEHILARSETYIGSKEPETVTTYIPEDGKVVSKTVTFVPAFLKIFDEVLTNAADNKVRDPQGVTYIKVTTSDTTISVENNGQGIPVELHQEQGIYNPELVFGHLLTGSNFDDTVERTTGGRNGLGVKLTNVFSKEFSVEVTCAGTKYKQTWKDNMTVMGKHKITSVVKPDSTKVTYIPDLSKFGMNSISQDHHDLLRKRVVDLCGSVRDIRVFLNGERVKCGSFKEYVQMYLSKTDFVHDVIGSRWEIAIGASSGAFEHVSFVNSIYTHRGGTHVNYITDQVVKKLQEHFLKKYKALVKPAQIKNHLFVFVNALVVNPTFDSQTKETLTLRASAFGSICLVDDNFVKRLLKLDLVERILRSVREKEDGLLKKTDGTRRRTITGIPDLCDANKAGTKDSEKCTLFLTEGKSALSFAISGISAIKAGRDHYGAFPLRGKLLNVRDCVSKQVSDNKELTELKKVLGLEHGKVYTSTKDLRYGSIGLLTDQDTDGFHISSLVMNWLDCFWPSLLELDGFLTIFITPIVKCTKAGNTSVFYNLEEYETWKETGGVGFKVKYYKGLGTSTDAESKVYFSKMTEHLKKFKRKRLVDSELLDLVFNKKRASDRKEWLLTYDPKNYLDYSLPDFTISDFLNKSLIQFSVSDNVRSIPSVLDGLKPSQRKVMYTVFKRKLESTSSEMKVAQLASATSEATEYRHGEVSLCGTIVGLAQNFVGSNNLELLDPVGQFGKRHQGGKDAASPRYIFTKMTGLTRLVFRPEDEGVLPAQVEDNQDIEPEFYLPVLPMVLVNGADGIGSGYSTKVPCYNPLDLIDLILSKLKGKTDLLALTPWYRGFTGDITLESPQKYSLTGKFTLTGGLLDIHELPIGVWTLDYKADLEKWVEAGIIREYTELHTDERLHFRVKLAKDVDDIVRTFKLETTIRTSNMVLFDKNGNLRRYETVEDIVDEYYGVRLDYYEQRRLAQIDVLEKQAKETSNKIRFITLVNSGELPIYQKTRAQVKAGLDKHHFTQSEGEYLLNLSVSAFTKERIDALTTRLEEVNSRIRFLTDTSPHKMWTSELSELKRHLLGETKK